MQKKRLYPLLEKHLFSILIADPLYQDLNCLSFFINLYRFQTQELDLDQARPFAPRSRKLRDELIGALEQELFIDMDDFEKHYAFRANRLALEITLLKDYYPNIAVEELDWVILYRAAQYESHSYVSVQAMSLLEQAYMCFKNHPNECGSISRDQRTPFKEKESNCVTH
jgi:hypothetical protein